MLRGGQEGGDRAALVADRAAGAIEQVKQAQYPREATVFAGDNIGAAPLVNALFDEEPAVIIANQMRVDTASVGNHEFDKGAAELLRIQQGGCPAGGCAGAPYARPDGPPTDVYPGAAFPYLSTNVVSSATGKPLLSRTYTKRRGSLGGGDAVGGGQDIDALVAAFAAAKPAGIPVPPLTRIMIVP